MEKFERRSVKYSGKKRGVAESEGTAHLLRQYFRRTGVEILLQQNY